MRERCEEEKQVRVARHGRWCRGPLSQSSAAPKVWNSVKLLINGVFLLILNNTWSFAFASPCLEWKFVLPILLYTICIFFLLYGFHVLLLLVRLIVPDGVHAEPRLLHAYSRHTSEQLILPPVNLQPSLLVICDGHPLVRPRARRHGVTVSNTPRRGV